jgi:hypothetical protein
MANSTELQLAIPTRVQVGFALSIEKREYTRITLMTQTLIVVSKVWTGCSNKHLQDSQSKNEDQCAF